MDIVSLIGLQGRARRNARRAAASLRRLRAQREEADAATRDAAARQTAARSRPDTLASS